LREIRTKSVQKGSEKAWTVMGHYGEVDNYQIQHGLDAATLKFIAADELELCISIRGPVFARK
jgi:hypothetical protein